MEPDQDEDSNPTTDEGWATQAAGIYDKAVAADYRLNPAVLATYMDHTLLHTDATPEQIDQLCAEAKEHRFAVRSC